MKPLRLALVQNTWCGDRAATARQLASLVADAAATGAALVCLPEFTLSPYFASARDDANYRWAEPLRGGESDRVFGRLAREHGVWLVGSLFERDGDTYWDTATVHAPTGELAAYTRKVHIPQGAGYYEDYYYGGADLFPVHEAAGARLSVPTCYDQWFPELSRLCALNGAELIVYPTAIGSEPEAPDLDTAEAWQTVMRGQAIASGVFIAAANRVGVEGVTFYGSSFICDPMGRVLAQAGRDAVEVISADLDPAVMTRWRRLFPLLRQRRPEVYGGLVARGGA